ncbi:hypothetical protein [Chryseobacterium sp.]|uniref:hypothetical protein n=1 Tax=Chryseobacterium sp. TaxID=1871047 RepID=UPI001B245754|nr:hypothetical protein [Chryseobacterium sp.]MBO9690797.1 hypothetical protein [Chryseobacterium sp.]
MKKLFLFGALLTASLTFANTFEVNSFVSKKETFTKIEQITNVQNVRVTKLFKGYYTVEFDLPCGGGHMTVTFASEFPNEAGNQGFIDDLANAVNSGVSQGCKYKAEFGL